MRCTEWFGAASPNRGKGIFSEGVCVFFSTKSPIIDMKQALFVIQGPLVADLSK